MGASPHIQHIALRLNLAEHYREIYAMIESLIESRLGSM